jgi:hypothetical protein
MIQKCEWKPSTSAKPPEIAQRLLLFLLSDQVRDNVTGDLSELYSAVIVPSCGISRARLWYWRQVACSMRLFFRFRKNPQTALKLWKGRIDMSKPMYDAGTLHPGISMHHIPVGGGAAGFLFVFATVFIFAVGIPAIRGLLVITAILGILGSGLLLYWHKRHALKIQSLHMHEEKQKR